jgi:hypothetical protein
VSAEEKPVLHPAIARQLNVAGSMTAEINAVIRRYCAEFDMPTMLLYGILCAIAQNFFGIAMSDDEEEE